MAKTAFCYVFLSMLLKTPFFLENLDDKLLYV